MNADTNQNANQNDFDAALTAYVNTVQARVDLYFRTQFPRLTASRVEVSVGPTYARVIIVDLPGGSASVHSFVRVADGAILFPAGWKAPVRKPSGVRGSIYDGAGESALAPAPRYHVRYLR